MKNEVTVCKTFSFDAAHQLVGHFGKCANLHGHTYKLEVKLRAVPNKIEGSTDEGFVIDFYHLKKLVNERIVDKMDHAFLAKGDEPALKSLIDTGAKVVVLGFRSTCENMAIYICRLLKSEGVPVHAVRMWETPTGWAEVLADDIDLSEEPNYNVYGGCDLDAN